MFIQAISIRNHMIGNRKCNQEYSYRLRLRRHRRLTRQSIEAEQSALKAEQSAQHRD